MNIPESPRVIYQFNPLAEVSCQLRFPTILKIGTQEPAEFQDRIRSQYPIYEIVQNLDLSPELQNLLTKFSNPLTTDFIYQFTSEDLTWRFFLHKEFIALATKQYSRYEEFKNRLKTLIGVFEEIYNPNFYSQVRLKYVDLIIQSELNLQEKWTELIQPHFANELQIQEFSESIVDFINIINLQIKDQGGIILKHGLVNLENEEKNIEEQGYLIETEFFTPPTINIQKGNDVWKCLDQYHALSGRIFRWSITEKLHDAMGPQPIDNNAS